LNSRIAIGTFLALVSIVVFILPGCEHESSSERADAGFDAQQVDRDRLFRTGERQVEVEDGKLRVFVVQLKQHVDDCITPDGFKERIESLIQSALPYISRKRANLFVFPEYTGYVCCFSGLKGKLARRSQSVAEAFVMLGVSYAPQIAHYLSVCPDISYQRALYLALTDAVWRPFHEAFSYIAGRYGVYIIATGVVSDTRVSREEDDISFFADPGFLPTDHVYLPVDENVYNQAVVYGPDGSILHRTRKVHLVQTESDLMDLSEGELGGLDVFELSGVNVGIAVCLDAWYSDVIDELIDQGMEFLIQPSANPKLWGYYTNDDYWEADGWYTGLWKVVTDRSEIAYGVSSMLTGNLFELPFDGQSSIVAGHPLGERAGYVGTVYRDGFVALAPWVIDDPCDGEPDESCRGAISQMSESLSVGGAHDNEYVETVIWADLDFDESD